MTTLAPASVEERLDGIETQLSEIARELRTQASNRERWTELTNDAMPIAHTAIDRATTELEQLGLTTEDVVGFARTAAEAIPTLTKAIAMLETASELAETVVPMAEPAFAKVMTLAGDLDQKGYFGLAQQAVGIADRVATSFTEDDVAALGENVVLILNTVKDMTQPEVMHLLSRTMLTVAEEEHRSMDDVPSTLGLIKEMRDPQVRLGLAKVMHMLKTVGEEEQAEKGATL